MKLIYQIPRNSLLWLLAAQTAVILPHLQHLPLGIIVGGVLVFVWRIQVYRGAWRYPGHWLKLLLVVLVAVSLKVGYGRLLGMEPMIALLISAFLLKLLEIHRRRDALVVIFLGYFVAATQFLLSQTLLATLYGLLTLVLLTTALLGIHQSQGHNHVSHSFAAATRLVLQAVPLMLLLFLVMPRIGALWAVPYQRHAAQTGVSDSMSPGDFSRLSRSGGLAFRAVFDGDIPSADRLYWRGLVFSRFDGRRWSQAEMSDYPAENPVDWADGTPEPWRRLAQSVSDPVGYSVILEATQQPWLYGLSLPVSLPGNLAFARGPKAPRIGLTRDFRLITREPVRKRMQYRLTSALDYRLEKYYLSPDHRSRELMLPRGYNPVTRRIAKRWRQQNPTPEALIQRLLAFYNREFTYTLEPPQLGRHSVDEFLWQTQRGFCEHFASSFVFFMRAAGIPARVVVGYQGGERSPLDEYLLVYQYDAHAWAEVWLEGQGWVRIDPTAAVAPSRIERGIAEALGAAESRLLASAFSLERYRHIALLNSFRLRWDDLNYNWHTWVMNYDDQAQLSFFQRWLGGDDAWRIALLLVGGGGGLLGVIALWLWWQGRRQLDPVVKHYLRFCSALMAMGVVRRRGEGARDFAARAITERPGLKSDIEAITGLYQRAAYGEDAEAISALRKRAWLFWLWRWFR